jgi:hypothetical protein
MAAILDTLDSTAKGKVYIGAAPVAMVPGEKGGLEHDDA